MGFKPEHVGLYFGQAQIDDAKENREADPNLQSAWQWLLAKEGEVVREIKPDKKGDEPTIVRKPKLTGLDVAVADAMRYCFADDDAAGQRAVQALQSTLQDDETLLKTIMGTIRAAHIYEMVRPLAGDTWRENFAAYTESLLHIDDPTPLDHLWLMTLRIVSGVVLEDAARFNEGVDKFKQVIEKDIHPEGYIKSLVDEEQRATFDDIAFGTAALVLAAEAATQAGVDLWAYTSRDVGVSTTLPYLVYYYFYPEKWHWKAEFTEDDTEKFFKQYGAFIEIATYRQLPRGVEILLDQQRPLFSGMMGGLTTLSHIKAKRKRRWFGFGG